MRLFGVNKTYPPPEDYLRQMNSDDLRLMSHIIMSVDAGITGDFNSPVFTVEMSKPLGALAPYINCTLPNKSTKIPRSYFSRHIDAETVLQLALEKNDIEAPFYLAMIYEHGITSQTKLDIDKIGGKRDFEKAEIYHSIAAERGSRFESVYQFLKDNHNVSNLPVRVDQHEFLANLIASPHEKIQSIYIDRLGSQLGNFTELGAMAAAIYAKKGSPYSIMQYIIMLLNYDEYSAYGDLMGIPLLCKFFSPDERILVAHVMSKKLVSLGAEGIEGAGYFASMINLV